MHVRTICGLFFKASFVRIKCDRCKTIASFFFLIIFNSYIDNSNLLKPKLGHYLSLLFTFYAFFFFFFNFLIKLPCKLCSSISLSKSNSIDVFPFHQPPLSISTLYGKKGRCHKIQNSISDQGQIYNS